MNENAWNTVAVLFFGYVLGVVSTWLFMRYGINLASRLIFQVKEDMPPEGAKPMEQEYTDQEEEEEVL